ncbi:uncharacterized [Tachysurus ichikawai]
MRQLQHGGSHTFTQSRLLVTDSCQTCWLHPRCLLNSAKVNQSCLFCWPKRLCDLQIPQQNSHNCCPAPLCQCQITTLFLLPFSSDPQPGVTNRSKSTLKSRKCFTMSE